MILSNFFEGCSADYLRTDPWTVILLREILFLETVLILDPMEAFLTLSILLESLLADWKRSISCFCLLSMGRLCFYCSFANFLEAVLYNRRILISLRILINFVDLAPILEALEALAILAILVAASSPPLLINWLTHIKSRIIVRVEIKSSQK